MAKNYLVEQPKIDRRANNTQIKLYQALKKYYFEGIPFKKIQVKQLCQTAAVSRATFYRHHQNIQDIFTIQLLIMITQFEKKIDELQVLNYETGSNVVVNTIYANLDLLQLMQWSGTEKSGQKIVSGAIIRILILREFDDVNRNFIADYLGAAILKFAFQISQAQEKLPKEQALKLYRLLVPKV